MNDCMFRRFVASAVVCLITVSASFASVKWHNPEKAGFPVVQGQAYHGQEREGFYHRFPVRAKDRLRQHVWYLSKDTAGESIVFTTDAKEITIRYTVTGGHSMPHMPATGVSGVDLYTHDRDGNEIWLAGKYSFKDTLTYKFAPIDIESRPKEHRYTLFLPLYNSVAWMEIGTEDGASFRFEPVLPAKPIVAYGTSICQGACASRPGMAWSNILQRRMGHEVVNLGFSGNAHMENEVIDLIAEIDAKVYLLDAMPNVCAFEPDAIRDTVLNAVRRLRSLRPETPIVLVDHLGYPHALANPNARNMQDKALEMQKIAYDQLMKEGIQGLHYLSYDEIALPLDGTVEGSHASDHGMVAYADAYEKKLRDILNEPVGEYVTTVPVVQQRDPYIWMDRHAHILREGAGKHFDRVIIGDSIMHFWGGADDAPVRNGQKVWEEFEGSSLNMGCGYDRTENVLWRIYHGQLDGFTADRIYLTIGINNFAVCKDNEEIVEGISMILSAILSRRPEAELTLMGIFPCRGREGRVKDINQELKVLARNKGVRFENPGRKLLKNGKIDESLCTDGLHPNEEGYRMIASYYR